ncbi:uncharacterized protein LOC121075087 isoform X3 [Cygnus olor]|uniref:uncharacterized protein LOC121075087 isoform X3 n=1 Tax=Cygnus olor TaxID=8869 RepID=UPI001ADE66C6|nr:uncharacterized protein LOC121075087 isoform X3 [Cygnus olor]
MAAEARGGQRLAQLLEGAGGSQAASRSGCGFPGCERRPRTGCSQLKAAGRSGQLQKLSVLAGVLGALLRNTSTHQPAKATSGNKKPQTHPKTVGAAGLAAGSSPAPDPGARTGSCSSDAEMLREFTPGGRSHPAATLLGHLLLTVPSADGLCFLSPSEYPCLIILLQVYQLQMGGELPWEQRMMEVRRSRVHRPHLLRLGTRHPGSSPGHQLPWLRAASPPTPHTGGFRRLLCFGEGIALCTRTAQLAQLASLLVLPAA